VQARHKRKTEETEWYRVKRSKFVEGIPMAAGSTTGREIAHLIPKEMCTPSGALAIDLYLPSMPAYLRKIDWVTCEYNTLPMRIDVHRFGFDGLTGHGQPYFFPWMYYQHNEGLYYIQISFHKTYSDFDDEARFASEAHRIAEEIGRPLLRDAALRRAWAVAGLIELNLLRAGSCLTVEIHSEGVFKDFPLLLEFAQVLTTSTL